MSKKKKGFVRKQRAAARTIEVKEETPMASFPDVTATIPEDFETTASVAPTDDDGQPAVLDSDPTWSGTPNCDVLDTAADGSAFDAKTRAIVPKMAAASGDTITATCTMVSEGETSTQNFVLTLSGGGVAVSGAGIGTAVKSTRRT